MNRYCYHCYCWCCYGCYYWCCYGCYCYCCYCRYCHAAATTASEATASATATTTAIAFLYSHEKFKCFLQGKLSQLHTSCTAVLSPIQMRLVETLGRPLLILKSEVLIDLKLGTNNNHDKKDEMTVFMSRDWMLVSAGAFKSGVKVSDFIRASAMNLARIHLSWSSK